QPLYTAGGATLAHDLALHAFYPIPAAELASVVAELRALSRLQDAPAGAPLSVSPALAAAEPPADYAPRLRALVSAYARWDRLVKLTVFGQNARSAAFAWIFRGVEVRGGIASERIVIPGIAAPAQDVLLAGGDTIYTTEPLADAPPGFAIALNGALFASATAAERMGALEALTELQNPARHDANDAQCMSCHVATFLTARRSATTGVDPAALPGRFDAPYNLTVDTIAARDGRVLRALGWASSFPAISQRVANETAQVLGELERRFPSTSAE
ncbi:MAG TPA: hypothetical protein VN253_07905, partial [Kofleriaceae bacterium]|nr:hypothetical protein [Kofleriaceae bacterium]